jgi:hypothetical protein
MIKKPIHLTLPCEMTRGEADAAGTEFSSSILRRPNRGVSTGIPYYSCRVAPTSINVVRGVRSGKMQRRFQNPFDMIGRFKNKAILRFSEIYGKVRDPGSETVRLMPMRG